jgi:hypothetical protein
MPVESRVALGTSESVSAQSGKKSLFVFWCLSGYLMLRSLVHEYLADTWSKHEGQFSQWISEFKSLVSLPDEKVLDSVKNFEDVYFLIGKINLFLCFQGGVMGADLIPRILGSGFLDVVQKAILNYCDSSEDVLVESFRSECADAAFSALLRLVSQRDSRVLGALAELDRISRILEELCCPKELGLFPRSHRKLSILAYMTGSPEYSPQLIAKMQGKPLNTIMMHFLAFRLIFESSRFSGQPIEDDVHDLIWLKLVQVVRNVINFGNDEAFFEILQTLGSKSSSSRTLDLKGVVSHFKSLALHSQSDLPLLDIEFQRCYTALVERIERDQEKIHQRFIVVSRPGNLVEAIEELFHHRNTPTALTPKLRFQIAMNPEIFGKYDVRDIPTDTLLRLDQTMLMGLVLGFVFCRTKGSGLMKNLNHRANSSLKVGTIAASGGRNPVEDSLTLW